MPKPPKVRDHFLLDLLRFAGRNKKWWLGPVVLVFVILAGIMVIAATEAAPFIYTLF